MAVLIHTEGKIRNSSVGKKCKSPDIAQIKKLFSRKIIFLLNNFQKRHKKAPITSVTGQRGLLERHATAYSVHSDDVVARGLQGDARRCAGKWLGGNHVTKRIEDVDNATLCVRKRERHAAYRKIERRLNSVPRNIRSL